MIIQHEKTNSWRVFIYNTSVFHNFKHQQSNYDLKLKDMILYQRGVIAFLRAICFSSPMEVRVTLDFMLNKYSLLFVFFKRCWHHCIKLECTLVTSSDRMWLEAACHTFKLVTDVDLT